MHRRWGASAVLVLAAAIGLAACGGDPTNPRHVASLSTTTTSRSKSDTSSTIAANAGNPTHLMDEWAACMRSHGDPNQTDPTIDSHGVINIILPLGVTPTMSAEVHGSTGPCSQYELAAENTLRAGQQYTGPSFAESVQYTNCMRAHGVPNYPDPSPDGRTDFNGTGVDPNSPFVEAANKVCGKKLGLPAWWINGWGPPGDVTVTSAGLNPGGGQPGGGSGKAPPVQTGHSGSGANG
jgi:hypothetical protein